MIDLSSQQMAAVVAGTNQKETYQLIDEDAWENWPFPLPSHLLDAHVNWMEGYGNSPSYYLRFSADPFMDRSGLVYDEIEPGCFLGKTVGLDFATCHYHRGGLRIYTPKDKEGNALPAVIQTPQQDGYAGRHFPIKLSPNHPKFPNEEVILRGPWHGGAPKGYTEVNYVVRPKVHTPKKDRWYRPWYRSGGYFGLLVPDVMFLAIMAKYRPELRFAQIKKSYGTFIEPLRPETNLPKGYFPFLPDMCDGHIIRGQSLKAQAGDRCIKCGERRSIIEVAG